MYEKKCKICSKEFKGNYPNESTCSPKCKKEATRLKNKRYQEKLANKEK